MQVSLEEGPRLYRWLAVVVSVLVWPFGAVESRRLEVAHRIRTGVVVTNHRSFFDVPMALVVFRRIRRYPRVLVAAHWFERPGTGQLLRLAGAIPLDRTNPAVHLEAARRVLGAGVPILVLPEGRLAGEPGRPTSTGEFKTGAARLAADCGVPVWALGHVGTDEVWPRDRALPRLNPLRRRRVVLVGSDRVREVDGDVRAATLEIHGDVVAAIEHAVETRNELAALSRAR